MIDQSFCEFLEYWICKVFQYLNDEATRGCWCDGVVLAQSESYYSQKFVNDNRAVQLKAFIGKDGQSEYELILKFGNKALSRYARNLDIKVCLPELHIENWFDIDIDRKKIQIQLD